MIKLLKCKNTYCKDTYCKDTYCKDTYCKDTYCINKMTNDFMKKDYDLLKKYIEFCIFYNDCGNSTLSLIYKNLPDLDIEKQKIILSDFKDCIIALMKNLENCNFIVSKLNISDDSLFYNNFKNIFKYTFLNLIFILDVIENYNI